jgi:hypothetical protein
MKNDKDDIFVGKIVDYVRVALYPFLVVASVGFVLTLIVHLSIWAGFPLGKYTIKLLLGIIIVWLPTVLVSLLLMREPEQKDFRKVCLRGCPAWMKKMSFVFSIYGFISIGFVIFGIFMGIEYGNWDKELPKIYSLSMSGISMMFYWAAFATLYSARKILEGDNMKSYPNGHRVAATEIFCPYCGEEMTSS